MLILGKIPVNEKTNIKELAQQIRAFSSIYVRSIFKNPRKLKNKSKVAHLLKLQTYIQKTYNTKQDILHIILYILHSLTIDNKGLLYIKKEQINTIKISEIYKLICFGNLEVQKSAIFYEAVNFSMKQIRMMNKYGH